MTSRRRPGRPGTGTVRVRGSHADGAVSLNLSESGSMPVGNGTVSGPGPEGPVTMSIRNNAATPEPGIGARGRKCECRAQHGGCDGTKGP